MKDILIVALAFSAFYKHGTKQNFWYRIGRASNILFPSKEWSKFPFKLRVKLLTK